MALLINLDWTRLRRIHTHGMAREFSRWEASGRRSAGSTRVEKQLTKQVVLKNKPRECGGKPNPKL